MSTRPERPNKKIRKLSTDSEGTEEGGAGYDWADRRRQVGRAEPAKSKKHE